MGLFSLEKIQHMEETIARLEAELAGQKRHVALLLDLRDRLEAELQQARRDNERLKKALELLKRGRWNVGTKQRTPSEFAAHVLQALAAQPEKPDE